MEEENRELGRQIYWEYVDLMNDFIRPRTEALVTELSKRNLEIDTFEGIPTFAAVLPKSVILELNSRNDIATIYLIDSKEVPLMDVAIPTTHVPLSWGHGYDGAGTPYCHRRTGQRGSQPQLPESGAHSQAFFGGHDLLMPPVWPVLPPVSTAHTVEWHRGQP